MRTTTMILLLGLLITGCNGDPESSQDPEDPQTSPGSTSDIRSVKRDIDQMVTTVAPQMAGRLGGEVRNASGRFVACQVGSDYRYIADFEVTDAGDGQDTPSMLGDILAKAGFDQADTGDDRVTAESDVIRATISERYPAGFRLVSFQSTCIDPGADGSYVEDAPRHTYPELS